MTFRHMIAIALSLVLGLAGTALAGAPGSGGRTDNIVAACQGGAWDGQSCTTSSECPGGACYFVLDETPGRPVLVLATLIIDDHSDAWDADAPILLAPLSAEPAGVPALGSIVSVSVLLEFIANGERHLLAQTYTNNTGEDLIELFANLEGGVPIADLPNSDRKLDEELGMSAIVEDGILDDFLFQRPDSMLEQGMRDAFQTGGDFTVASAKLRNYADFSGKDSRASTIRMLLTVAVTPSS